MSTSRRTGPRRTGTAPEPSPRQRGGRGGWGRVLLWLVVVPGLVAVLGFAAWTLTRSVPLPADLEVGITVVLDANGDEIGTFATEASRRDVDATELPPHVTRAVLAAEDRGFYEHSGVSATGILRALVTNVRTGDLTGQGGSTITQQYVKNALLTPDQTVSRKLNEAALSIQLERAYTKDEILSFYLSTIYWGRGAYGIESAARTYYGVSATELTVNQAATLAGIIRAPEALDPVEEPEAVDRRRQYVLDGMLEQGWLTQQQHDDVVAAGLPTTTTGRPSTLSGDAAYFVDAVRREVAPIVGDANLYAGLTIRTTMVPAAQRAAQEAISAAVVDGAFDSGALVAVDPRSGAITALVGGPDFGRQQLNVAVQGSNQVGSAFKAVTLTRWVSDGYSPESVFPADAEIEVAETTFTNYGGSSYGEQTVREATITSTNTVYVQMQQELGGRAVIDSAVAMGLPTTRDGVDVMTPSAGLTLGQDEFTVREVAGAYATLAAGGVRRPTFLVTEVRDRDGALVFERRPEEVQAVDAGVASVVTDVLVDVVATGTGAAASLEDRPVAGKTGTTNDNRDAWFVGYTPELVAAVWVGNLTDTPVEGMTGGGAAAPVWQRFASAALAGTQPRAFPEPDLDGLLITGEQPAPCPDGYARTEAPTIADDATVVPDVIDDGEDEPCVEISPTPTPTPTPSETPVPDPTSSSPPPGPEPSPTDPPPSPDPTDGPDPSEPPPDPDPTVTDEPSSPDPTSGP